MGRILLQIVRALIQFPIFQQMAYPQQGYFVQAPMPQPQRFFNQAQANVRGAQPRWPQQPRGAIPPGQMQMGMNAGFRTRGPSGPRMNQAQAAAAAAMAARPMGQQMMPAMMRLVLRTSLASILNNDDIR